MRSERAGAIGIRPVVPAEGAASPEDSAIRARVARLIWLADFLLKYALGYLMVFLFWMPCRSLVGSRFGLSWVIAGGILGACLNGCFEGCNLILLGWAKRVAKEG